MASDKEEHVSSTASASTSLVPTDQEAESEYEGFFIVNHDDIPHSVEGDIPHSVEQLQQDSAWRSAAQFFAMTIQRGPWLYNWRSLWQNPGNIIFDDWLKDVEIGLNNSADEETFKHYCLHQAILQYFQQIIGTDIIFDKMILETAVPFTREEIQYANHVSAQRNRRFLRMILNRDYMAILKFLWKLISFNKDVVEKVIDCYKTELDKSKSLPANQCTKCLLEDRVSICLIVDRLIIKLKDFHSKVSEELQPAMPSVSKRLWTELFEQTRDGDSYESVITLITSCIEDCGYHTDIVRRLNEDKVQNRNSFYCSCQSEHTDAVTNVSDSLSVQRNIRSTSECKEKNSRIDQKTEQVSTKERKKYGVSSSEAYFKQHRPTRSNVYKRKISHCSGKVRNSGKPFNNAKKSKNSSNGQVPKTYDGYALNQVLPRGTQNGFGYKENLKMELLKHGKREYDEFEDSKVSASSSESTDSGVESNFRKRQRDEETKVKKYGCKIDFDKFYDCNADNVRTSPSDTQSSLSSNSQVTDDSENEYNRMDVEGAYEIPTNLYLDVEESEGCLEGEPMLQDEDSNGV